MNREKLREWIPPAALRTARSYLRTYPDYASASVDCKSVGYNDDDIGQVVARKTVAYFQRSQKDTGTRELHISELQLITALHLTLPARADGVIRVVDFGGASGAAYFLMTRLLPAGLSLDWTVVETPAMVRAAREHVHAPGLRFVDDLDAVRDGGPIDLVYSSGTIGFTPDPFGFVDRLMSLDARAMAVVRLQSTDSPAPFTVVFQTGLRGNGPGPVIEGLPPDRALRYPCTFLPRARMRERLSTRYDIVYECYDPTAHSSVIGRPTTGWSYFCKRRAAAVS